MLLPVFLLLAGAESAFARCKCSPTDDCWPSRSKWTALNSTVHGKLIQNEPLAKPCYPGTGYDAKTCQNLVGNWTDNTWVATSPIAYSYPLIDTCPPVTGSQVSYPFCDLGNSPLYSIAATQPEDVAAGIKFAKDNDVRLVIKNTGHDISFKSQGYGSLSIWMYNYKTPLKFHKNFVNSNGSSDPSWRGSAVTIGAGYAWKEVYNFANKYNHVVVGGADPTVGCIGGYMQGAGHGSLSHEFGLGTDQVLEYEVVLASGKVVKANQYQYTDLFTALRGGGGGTYGVVTSATVKSYPDRPTLYSSLTIQGLNKSSPVISSVAKMAAKYPAIVDEGFAGTSIMKRDGQTFFFEAPFIKFLANDSAETITHAKKVMQQEIINDLLPGNGTDYIVQSSMTVFPSWHAWYFSTKHTSVGNNQPIMASRFFGKESLVGQENNLTRLLTTMNNLDPAQSTSSWTLFNIVAGGKVFEDAPNTSVNPAWRKTYILLQQIEAWNPNAGTTEINRIWDRLTFKKLAAMKAMAPGMGTYQNEADPHDPDWRHDWFGDKYDWLRSVKTKYDPDDVFWCWRCVGNEGWEEVTGGTVYGPLCQTN